MTAVDDTALTLARADGSPDLYTSLWLPGPTTAYGGAGLGACAIETGMIVVADAPFEAVGTSDK